MHKLHSFKCTTQYYSNIYFIFLYAHIFIFVLYIYTHIYRCALYIYITHIHAFARTCVWCGVCVYIYVCARACACVFISEIALKFVTNILNFIIHKKWNNIMSIFVFYLFSKKNYKYLKGINNCEWIANIRNNIFFLYFSSIKLFCSYTNFMINE